MHVLCLLGISKHKIPLGEKHVWRAAPYKPYKSVLILQVVGEWLLVLLCCGWVFRQADCRVGCVCSKSSTTEPPVWPVGAVCVSGEEQGCVGQQMVVTGSLQGGFFLSLRAHVQCCRTSCAAVALALQVSLSAKAGHKAFGEGLGEQQESSLSAQGSDSIQFSRQSCSLSTAHCCWACYWKKRLPRGNLVISLSNLEPRPCRNGASYTWIILGLDVTGFSSIRKLTCLAPDICHHSEGQSE